MWRLKTLFVLAMLYMMGCEAFAADLQAAAGVTQSGDRDSRTLTTSYGDDVIKQDGLRTTLDWSGSVTRTDRRSKDSFEEQLWHERTSLLQRQYGVSSTTEFNKRWGVGLGYFKRQSEVSTGHSRSLSAYTWLLGETLRLGSGLRLNEDSVPSAEFIDTDVTRVKTPEFITGKVLTLDATYLANETTILEGQLGTVEKSDRPVAKFTTIKARKFLKGWASALHLRGTSFVNEGEIKPITATGEVTAKTYEIEWHQRHFDKMLVVAGYRYNIEEHRRRAAPRTTESIGSDFVWVELGWRDYKDVWTDPSPEYFAVAGKYQNSADKQAQTYGLGIRLPLGGGT